MADSSIRIVDQIIGQSQIVGEALFDEIRELIEQELKQAPTAQILIGTLRSILERTQPMLIEHLRDTDLAAWIAGQNEVYKQFPAWLVEEFKTSIRDLPPAPPTPPGRFRLFGMFDDAPRLRFPIIEEAANSLAESNVITREQFDAASAAAQARAFFITDVVKADAIEKVRDELVADIESGTSLDSFKNRIADIVEVSSLGPARIETIYRTNIQSAFRDGRETLASDRIVSEVFPYQAYIAVHDGRVRSNHLALESLGLDGTNVYRRDDPFWDSFTPPNGYNSIASGELIKTSRGEIPIENVRPGDMVVTHQGNWRPVLGIHCAKGLGLSISLRICYSSQFTQVLIQGGIV